jgi:hypothetical protein
MRFPDLDGLFIYCVWDADTQRRERKRSPLTPMPILCPCLLLHFVSGHVVSGVIR